MGAVPRYLLRPAGHRPSVVVGTFTTGGASWNVVRPIADSYFRVESGSGGAWHRVQSAGSALIEVVAVARFFERVAAQRLARRIRALGVIYGWSDTVRGTSSPASRHVVWPIADSNFRVESGSGGAWHRVQDTGAALVKVVTISRFLERGTADWFAVGTGAFRVICRFAALTATFDVVRPIAHFYLRVEGGAVRTRFRVQNTCSALVKVLTIVWLFKGVTAQRFSFWTGTHRIVCGLGVGGIASRDVFRPVTPSSLVVPNRAR